MTIYQRMEEVFRLADVPGFLQVWRKTEAYPAIPDVYAVYNVQSERPLICADDAAQVTRYDIRIYVYGIEDISGDVANILDALQVMRFQTPRAEDAYAKSGGEFQYVKQIDTTFIDYGEYGEEE